MCYLEVISTRSTFTETAYNPGTKLVGVAFKLRKRMKNSPSVVDSRFPQNLEFSHFTFLFSEDGKEIYQHLKRTCRAIVFPHQTYCFAALSLPSPSLLLKFPTNLSARLFWARKRGRGKGLLPLPSPPPCTSPSPCPLPLGRPSWTDPPTG